MSALDSEDRSWPFGSLAEVLDPFVLDGASGALGATPRVIKMDVNTDAHGLVSGLSVEVTGSGMTQAQVIGLLGAPADERVCSGRGGSGGRLGGASIAPALLQTARVCLAVSRAAEDSSIGRAVVALVSREKLVGGAGGGGGGMGRGNYVVPLAIVNAEGKPIAGRATHTHTYTHTRRTHTHAAHTRRTHTHTPHTQTQTHTHTHTHTARAHTHTPHARAHTHAALTHTPGTHPHTHTHTHPPTPTPTPTC
jgi:hypothetical protein